MIWWAWWSAVRIPLWRSWGLTGTERDGRTKSPSMSFDRDVGDMGLERRRGGHSCVPEPYWLGGGEVVCVCVVDWWRVRMGGCRTGHSGLIIINHLPGHMFVCCYSNCCLTMWFPSNTLQCMHRVCVCDRTGPGKTHHHSVFMRLRPISVTKWRQQGVNLTSRSKTGLRLFQLERPKLQDPCEEATSCLRQFWDLPVWRFLKRILLIQRWHLHRVHAFIRTAWLRSRIFPPSNFLVQALHHLPPFEQLYCFKGSFPIAAKGEKFQHASSNRCDIMVTNHELLQAPLLAVV